VDRPIQLSIHYRVDIDAGKGYDIEMPEIKKIVEEAAQFFIDHLRENGIIESVWALFRCGIYVMLHSAICAPSRPEGRAEFFEIVTDRFNNLIEYISTSSSSCI